MTELHKIEEANRKAALFKSAIDHNSLKELEYTIKELFDLPWNTQIGFDIDNEKQSLKVTSTDFNTKPFYYAWRHLHLDTFGKATPHYSPARDEAFISIRLGFYHETWRGGFNFSEIGTARYSDKNKMWNIDFEIIECKKDFSTEKYKTILD